MRFILSKTDKFIPTWEKTKAGTGECLFYFGWKNIWIIYEINGFFSNDHQVRCCRIFEGFTSDHFCLFQTKTKTKSTSSFSDWGLTESSCSSFWGLLWFGVQTNKRQSKIPLVTSSAGKLLLPSIASFHSCNTKRRCLRRWVLCLRQQLEWHHFHLQ